MAITVHGGEAGIPAGLCINGPMQGDYLLDGRLFIYGLPVSVVARYYPDFVYNPAMDVPTIDRIRHQRRIPIELRVI